MLNKHYVKMDQTNGTMGLDYLFIYRRSPIICVAAGKSILSRDHFYSDFFSC